ncbi:8132_t:CDS:2, partial [Paraglomus occultum]
KLSGDSEFDFINVKNGSFCRSSSFIIEKHIPCFTPPSQKYIYLIEMASDIAFIKKLHAGRIGGGIEERVKEMDPVIFDSIRRMVPGKKRGRKICELVGRLTGVYLKMLPGDPLDSQDGAGTNDLSGIPGLKVHFTESSGNGNDRLRATKILSKIFEPKNSQSMNIRIELIIESDANGSNFLLDNVIVKEALKKLEKDYTLKGKKNAKKQKKGKNNDESQRGKIRIEVVVKELEVN